MSAKLDQPQVRQDEPRVRPKDTPRVTQTPPGYALMIDGDSGVKSILADDLANNIAQRVHDVEVALPALSGMYDGASVHAEFYYADERDVHKVEHWFIYHSDSTLVPDGGTVIQPDAGSGRWLRIAAESPKCEWFGGLADGSVGVDNAVSGTNNTNAVELCLKAYHRVKFLSGVYGLNRNGYGFFLNGTGNDGTLDFVAQGARIEGGGIDVTTLARLDCTDASDVNTPVWMITTEGDPSEERKPLGVQIRDLTLNCNGGHTLTETGQEKSSGALFLQRADCVVERVKIVQTGSANSSSTAKAECFSLKIHNGNDPDNKQPADTGDPVPYGRTAVIRDVEFTDNAPTSSRDPEISPFQCSGVEHVYIEGCFLHDMRYDATHTVKVRCFTMGKCKHVLIRNNTISDVDGYGYWIDNGWVGDVSIQGNNFMHVVEACTVTNSWTASGSPLQVDSITFQDNFVHLRATPEYNSATGMRQAAVSVTCAYQSSVAANLPPWVGNLLVADNVFKTDTARPQGIDGDINLFYIIAQIIYSTSDNDPAQPHQSLWRRGAICNNTFDIPKYDPSLVTNYPEFQPQYPQALVYWGDWDPREAGVGGPEGVIFSTKLEANVTPEGRTLDMHAVKADNLTAGTFTVPGKIRDDSRREPGIYGQSGDYGISDVLVDPNASAPVVGSAVCITDYPELNTAIPPANLTNYYLRLWGAGNRFDGVNDKETWGGENKHFIRVSGYDLAGEHLIVVLPSPPQYRFTDTGVEKKTQYWPSLMNLNVVLGGMQSSVYFFVRAPADELDLTPPTEWIQVGSLTNPDPTRTYVVSCWSAGVYSPYWRAYITSGRLASTVARPGSSPYHAAMWDAYSNVGEMPVVYDANAGPGGTSLVTTETAAQHNSTTRIVGTLLAGQEPPARAGQLHVNNNDEATSVRITNFLSTGYAQILLRHDSGLGGILRAYGTAYAGNLFGVPAAGLVTLGCDNNAAVTGLAVGTNNDTPTILGAYGRPGITLQAADPNLSEVYFNSPDLQGTTTLGTSASGRLIPTGSVMSGAGYGGMYLSDRVSSIEIDDTWKEINCFDLLSVADPRGVNLDVSGIVGNPPNGRFSFRVPGVWSINVNFALSFTSVNDGRQMFFRLRNTVSGWLSQTYIVFVGRDQQGANAIMQFLTDVPTDALFQPYVFDVSNAIGDQDFGISSFRDADICLMLQSEWIDV